MANRVHRARVAQLTAQQERATAAWHDRRDSRVGKLWKEISVTRDATEVLSELRTTTLGLRALSGEWIRLKALLEDRGYWMPGELDTIVLLSGSRLHERMALEDEDAYRLYLWNFRLEPEPPWDMIERMLEPGFRPPGLRDIDNDLLLPSPAECLARLKQWVDDVLVELEADAAAGLDRGRGSGTGPAYRPAGDRHRRSPGEATQPRLQRIPVDLLQGSQRDRGDPKA